MSRKDKIILTAQWFQGTVLGYAFGYNRKLTLPAKNDKKYLELHGGKWRVSIAVPKDLQARLGTRLKRPIHTDSLTVANSRKWTIVAELQQVIEQARGSVRRDRQSLMLEAASLKRDRDDLSEEARHHFDSDLRSRWYDLAAPDVRTKYTETGPDVVWEGEHANLASDYLGIIHGTTMPLRMFYEEYLAKISAAGLKARTLADDRRAIAYLERWCQLEQIKEDLRAVTTAVAKRFAVQMYRVAGDIAAATQKKYINRLKLYFDHVVYHEHLPSNPWMAVVLKVPRTPHDEEERAFTDDEVRRLLTGSASMEMADLMRFGALTGARLDAIVCLRVKDAKEGGFTFKKQKREKTERDVPIHPDLEAIVKRRSVGKNEDDYIFHEWPEPQKEDSLREKSFKASNQFTAYRRKCGVDQVIPGRRRALVNFHSFRRWFITKAERSGASETLIAAIVGHKRSGITLGRYSEGPEWNAARKCVEAVKLPPLDSGPVAEARSLTPRQRDVI